MCTQRQVIEFPATPPLPGGLESLLFFGGSFDPVHRAHVSLAECAAKQFGCDHILFVPARCSPHKMGNGEGPAKGIDRWRMLLLAVEGCANISVSEYEVTKPAPSYTVDTLESLRNAVGDGVRIYFLLGSDQAISFSRWYRYERILELATPAIVLREPYGDWQLMCRAGLDTGLFTKEMVVEAALDAVSSTAIRERLRGDFADEGFGGELEGMGLSPAVREYIRAHHLYGL